MPAPYPLAVFTGNADAAAQSDQQAFEKLMGVSVIGFNAFVDFTDIPDHFLNNTTWFAGVCKSAPGYQPPMLPLIHLPTFSTSSSAPSEAQILANFTDGAYDGMINGFVQAWAAAGYKAMDYRVGIEMNLSDGTYTYQGLEPQWIVAFQHISTKLRAAFAQYGVKGRVMWNPGVVNGTLAGNAIKNMWPGKQYVDIIGADCYDNNEWCCAPYTAASLDANPALLEMFYTYPAMSGTSATAMPTVLDSSNGVCLSLQNLIDFAIAQDLPFCLPETGCGSGPTDNPYFPAWLRKTIDGGVAKGLQFEYLSVWNSNGGGNYKFTDGSKPQQAAAWAANFGVNAPAASKPPAPYTGHVSPANTQVNGPGGSITDSNGTTWQINAGEQIEYTPLGGTLTVEKTSANVVTLFWDGTNLDQLNGSGDWWTQPLTGGGGESMTQPPGYVVPAPAPSPVPAPVIPTPTPVAPTPVPTPAPAPTPVHAGSLPGTQLPPVPIPVVDTIYDGQGGAWTLPKVGGQIFLNGDPVASSSDVIAMFWTGVGISQLNGAGEWWTQPLDGSPGELTFAPSGYIPVS